MNARDPITWRRLREIFGNPPLVNNVTQRQFDYNDDKLKELGRTPYNQVSFDDLWYYHHDLAYSELQPELFAHLFPVCLMDWHLTLQANRACSHGDSEFHYGIIQGNVFDTMLNKSKRAQVEEVFRDSFLYRIDQERGFIYSGASTPANRWIFRLNSLGLFLEALPQLWKDWWGVATPGRAVALLQYCSGFMYFEGENPLFEAWDPDQGGGGPYLWEHDANVYDRGWTEANLLFLRNFLTVDQVGQGIREATARLQHEPEREIADQINAEVEVRRDLIETRVTELPTLLATSQSMGWTI